MLEGAAERSAVASPCSFETGSGAPSKRACYVFRIERSAVASLCLFEPGSDVPSKRACYMYFVFARTLYNCVKKALYIFKMARADLCLSFKRWPRGRRGACAVNN